MEWQEGLGLDWEWDRTEGSAKVWEVRGCYE